MAEHSILTGSSLHEPKGADSAASGQIYFANGSGSGSWKGNPGNTYGEMIITGNTSPTTVPSAVDTTLSTDSDYIKSSSNWVAGALSGITFDVDKLVVPISGVYFINIWASYEVSVANILVGIKFAINDTMPYSERKLLMQSKTTSDVNMMSGHAVLADLSAGDSLSIYIAVDGATDVTGREVGVTLVLLSAA